MKESIPLDRLFLLNSPILTGYGDWTLSGPLSLSQVKQLLLKPFVSAIGHQSTALVLTQLLGVEVPMVRQAIAMHEGDRALIFRIRARLPEGRTLSASELHHLDYEFGLLECIAESNEGKGH